MDEYVSDFRCECVDVWICGCGCVDVSLCLCVCVSPDLSDFILVTEDGSQVSGWVGQTHH